MTFPEERIVFPDQTWYDANNPGPLHDALRADYARAKAAIQRRPSLRRHMADCTVCQAITAATATAPNPIATRRRIKLVLDQERMRTLLGLPDRFEIVHMFADNDPNIVTILVAGEGLPAAPPDAETPIMPLDVIAGTGNRAS